MANTFDSVPDPGAVGGAFAGSAVGPALAGISPTLASVVIDVGKKKTSTHETEPGYAGYPMNEIPVQQVPDLISLDKAALHIFQVEPPELSGLQKQMWDGGWYSNTTYANGYTAGNIQAGDENDQAWNSVVLTSARTGKSVQEVLQEAVDRVNAAGGLDKIGKGGAASQRTVTQTAKVDLYHYGNAIARTLIGRDMPRDQMDKFIAQYQSQEKAGSAGSPEASAESFLQNENPGQVGAMKMVDAFDKLMQMVGNVKPVNLGTGQ